MPSMKKATKSKKSSMQLLIGTYVWAVAKLRESPEDRYAAEIVLEHELLIRPKTCMRNGGTDECTEGPRGQNKCGLCGRRGL